MNKKVNGYITVEAALVVAAILLSLNALIVAILFLYQHALLTNIATDTARRGAEIWRDSRRRISDGAWDPALDKDPAYNNLFELVKLSGCEYTCTLDDKGEVKQENKPDASSKTVYSRLKILAGQAGTKLSGGVVKPSISQLYVRYDNGLIKKTVTVRISQEINIPLGVLKSFFDGSKTITLNAASSSSSVDPAAFIRNVDFIAELAENSIPLSFDQLVDRIKTVLPGGLE